MVGDLYSLLGTPTVEGGAPRPRLENGIAVTVAALDEYVDWQPCIVLLEYDISSNPYATCVSHVASRCVALHRITSHTLPYSLLVLGEGRGAPCGP